VLVVLYPAFIEDRKYFGQVMVHADDSHDSIVLKNFRALNELALQGSQSPSDLIQAYLRKGIEIFDLPWAFVCKIEEQSETFVALNTPSKDLKVGDTVPLESSYCREVYRSRQIIGLPHIGKIPELIELNTYQSFHLEAYLAAPIYLAGEFYGTVAFCSTIPRSLGFSEHERELIASIANALGQILLQQQHEQQMHEIQQKLHKVVGMVAHDLRGPLGCIQGYTKIFPRCKSEGKRKQIIDKIGRISENSLDMVQSLLNYSTLKLNNLPLNQSQFDFFLLAHEVVNNYQEMFRERSLNCAFQISPETLVYADRGRIYQILDNLITNALKYAQFDSTLTFTARPQGTKIQIQLRNQIAKAHIDLNQNSVMNGSSGLGLEIVRDILFAHGSKLHQERSSNLNFEISFYLNQQPEASV